MHTYNRFTKATQIKRQPRGRKVCDFWRHAKPIAGNSNTVVGGVDIRLTKLINI